VTRARELAREAFARQLDRKGSAWANTAWSVRTGYENIWITTALDALEPLVLLSADGDDEDGGT
jgi:hypothetical protein